MPFQFSRKLDLAVLLEYARNSNCGLKPRKLEPHAAMQTVTKRDVLPLGSSIDLQFVGILEYRRIMIGCSEDEEHPLSSFHGNP